MTRRAELVDATRQRIIEAAAELHGSVGPAATTIAGIAARAEVTRATVYRHFADDEAIFAACSAHWFAQQTMPNPASWAAVDDAEARLRAGLTDLYRFYRDGVEMLTRINADIDALPAHHRAGLEARGKHHRDVLAAAFPRAGSARVRALVGHAVAFWTWHSLCVQHEMSNRDAVEAMTRLVTATASRPGPRP